MNCFLSFPRKRESRPRCLDSRFRGNDKAFSYSYFAALILLSFGSVNTISQRGDNLNAKTAFVDTSAYPMHPSFKGWTGDTAHALNNLRDEIEDILSNGGRGITSAKIIFFDTGNAVHEIYSLHANESVLPASTEKLFTSSSTLWALGSKYEFTTRLDLAPGAKIEGNRIVGNVYLRPSGDPTLKSSDLDDLAEQILDKGISSIQGDIVSDLDGENPLSAEAQKYMSENNSPPISSHDSIVGDNGMISSADTAASDDEDDEDESEAGALSTFPNFSLDRNIVSVTVIGGRAKGTALGVKVYPPLASIVVVNHGKSSAPATYRVKKVGRGHHRRIIRRRIRGVMTLRVSSTGGPMDAKQVISITGQFPARSQRTYSVAIRNVPMAMAAAMKLRLQQNGISVMGKPRVDRATPDSTPRTIAEKKTRLIDLLTQMNKRSDNYLAESMFRKLSAIAQIAASAPDERARKVMRSWLKVCNVDGTNCTLIDGSGLSRNDSTTANTVVSLLVAINKQGWLDVFTHTLSIAGYDGTLRNRMKGTPAQYNAHGKTGTLDGVTALAGYVTTGDGQLAAYFITMQHYRGGPWTYKREQDKVVETLAGFKYADYVGGNTIPSLGKIGSSK